VLEGWSRRICTPFENIYAATFYSHETDDEMRE